MLRKDIILDIFNEANQKVASYAIREAWVSKSDMMPSLDNGNIWLIQGLDIQHEGYTLI